MFPWQRRIVESVVSYAIRVVSKGKQAGKLCLGDRPSLKVVEEFQFADIFTHNEVQFTEGYK
jgi:hypothetical protein